MTNGNKQIVQRFFDTLTSGDYDLAFQAVDEAVVWWVPGTLPFSGDKTKSQYMAIARSIQKGFPTGFKLTVVGSMAEGDKVAAEVESSGTHVNGRLYRNKYHFLFQLRDEKIVHVKEYMDTLHLAQLIAP